MINYETPIVPFNDLQKVIKVVSDLGFDVVHLRNRLVEYGSHDVVLDHFHALHRAHNFYHARPWSERRLEYHNTKPVVPFIVDTVAIEIDEHIEQIEEEVTKNFEILKELRNTHIFLCNRNIGYKNDMFSGGLTLMDDFVDKYNKFLHSLEYLSDFIYSHHFK